MDSKDDTAKLEQVYRLLALCARARGHSAFYDELKRQLSVFTAWDELPSQAETHGMSSLLLHHIQDAKIQIPQETERTLKGLYLRNRANNEIHKRVLLEILERFDHAGIHPLVLKGLALAYQYYPDPALRPVSDIDLLLDQKDISQGWHLLLKAGFNAHTLDGNQGQLPSELTALSPPRNGISIAVELHHYNPNGRATKSNSPDPEFKGLAKSPNAFTINGNIIYTSAPLETLHYLSRHLTKHLFIANNKNPVQLKWIADITSLVEYHAEEFDWKHLQQHHADLLNRLELFYSLTPLPNHLEGIIPIKQVVSPAGINCYPPGWPHQSIQQWRRTGYVKFIFQVFSLPSAWWTRLYYGVNGWKVPFHQKIVYRIQILSAMFWVIRHKIRHE